MTSLVWKLCRECMPQFTMTLQTEIISKETLDFLEQKSNPMLIMKIEATAALVNETRYFCGYYY